MGAGRGGLGEAEKREGVKVMGSRAASQGLRKDGHKLLEVGVLRNLKMMFKPIHIIASSQLVLHTQQSLVYNTILSCQCPGVGVTQGRGTE